MNFQVLIKALKISTRQFPGFLKKYGLIILLLFLPFEFFDQSFMRLASLGDENLKIIGTVASTLNSLMQALVIVTSVPYLAKTYIEHQTSAQLSLHWREHLFQVMIESFRAMARIFIGFVLLIIPGIVLTVRYYFVPYVTQFNPKYQQGELDALRHSRDLVRGKAWSVLVFMSVFTLLIFQLDLYQLRFNIFTDIAAWIGLSVALFLLDAFVGLASLNFYQELEKETLDESNV